MPHECSWEVSFERGRIKTKCLRGRLVALFCRIFQLQPEYIRDDDLRWLLHVVAIFLDRLIREITLDIISIYIYAIALLLFVLSFVCSFFFSVFLSCLLSFFPYFFLFLMM